MSEQGKGISLRAAGYNFRRTRALFDESIKIKGCNAHFEKMSIGDINTYVFSGSQTLDVTEIGLHPFMLAYANEDFRAYTLLPIFPLRLFRHRSVFIRTDRGIEKPEDLKGKTIATPGYSTTSLTWIRGIFQDEYDVRPEDIDWITTVGDSSADIAGKRSRQEQVAPAGVSIRLGPEGKDESDLIESGEVDALFNATEPRAYIERHPQVERLFPDYRAVESTYFAKTGIFPIMHVVAIKRELLQQYHWLAEAVFNAYSQAKRIAYVEMAKIGWIEDMLPWYGQELEDTGALMGSNFYSYGIKANRTSLEALFRYSFEQGLSRRELTVEELFDPLSFGFAEDLV